MIKKRRKREAVLFVFIFVLCFAHPVRAAAPADQVYDGAGLLSETEIGTLTDTVDALEEKTGWDVMIVTVDDPAVSSVRTYAEEMFDKLTKKDDGIIYLLDMNGRELYLATAGEAIHYMTDARIDEAIADAVSYAGDGAYAYALNVMVTDTMDFYEAGIPENHGVYDEEDGSYTYYHEKPERSLKFGEIMGAVIIAAAAAVIFCLVIIGKYRLKFGRYHYDIYANSSVELSRKEDRLINQFVTRRRIPKSPPPSGGGGTSTVHHGAGGRSFGGGGGKF